MEASLAFLAAVVATGFCLELVAGHLARPRPHAAAWSAAMFMYAAATWALFAGLAVGWSSFNFRVFYLFGAILNVLFLALGAAYLVLGHRVAGGLLVVFGAFSAGAGAATFGARFVTPLPDAGVPEGIEMFQTIADGALASPRLWALIGNTVGTVLLLALALYTVARFWRANRGLAYGNLLIVGGTVAPVIGGSLTALGDGGGLALSLLAGAALLWAGYRVAGRARITPASAAGAPPAVTGGR